MKNQNSNCIRTIYISYIIRVNHNFRAFALAIIYAYQYLGLTMILVSLTHHTQTIHMRVLDTQ